ncbi:glycine receptor subunit alpha-2 [Elysia marginata]|uniref:Glycine receptor subunit alpha-2 n=1 Tax=Elysia marginata TaxID=1093978 RepID=A0AAV4HNN1_9GAST|nr:glycine receptor subunit alpha-2 [Elysia marginata]
MDYSLTVYLRQKWQDKRLQFEIFPLEGDHPSEILEMERLNTTLNHRNSSSANSTFNTNSSETASNVVLIDHLELDTRLMDKVWYPDTFFINEREAKFHEVTVPNKLMHIFSNGTVFYSLR